MQDSSHDGFDLSDILDGSISARTKRAGKVAGRVRKDYEKYKQEAENLDVVLEKTPTLQQQRDRQILSDLSDNYRGFQRKTKPTGPTEKRDEKISDQQKVREPVKVEGVRSAHQKIPEPVIKESDKTGKKIPKKARTVEGSLLDQSLSGSKKIREPVVVEKVESEEKKLHISARKSQEEKDQEQIFEQSSIEEAQALLHKEDSTGGYLYVLGNILLDVVSLGIVHAIFYIGSLIAFGARMQKWESKDPITWFFHRLNAKVVFKTEADVKRDDFNADEISCGV